MREQASAATQLNVRVPRAEAKRLDELARSVGRSRSEIARYWLAKLRPTDLPAGWREDAAALRSARAAR